MEPATVLIVEDERIIALDLRAKVARLGHKVVGMAHTGADAVRLAGELKPGVVLMDIILAGDMDGIEAARRIRMERDVPVIFVSACNDSATKERACGTGFAGFVSKPVDPAELSARIEAALAKRP
jgi:DNA-binding response OmpR family regulator